MAPIRATLPVEPKRRFRAGAQVRVKATGESGRVQRYDTGTRKYAVRVREGIVFVTASGLQDFVTWAQQQRALTAALRKDR